MENQTLSNLYLNISIIYIPFNSLFNIISKAYKGVHMFCFTCDICIEYIKSDVLCVDLSCVSQRFAKNKILSMNDYMSPILTSLM